jgi:ubiquinone biosynthesis protein UbiJ
METTWQDRVREERAELGEKLQKLSDFIGKNNSETMDALELATLQDQYMAMRRYLEILDDRISRF